MGNWMHPNKTERRDWRRFVKSLDHAVRRCVLDNDYAPWKIYRLTSRSGQKLQRVVISSFIAPNEAPRDWSCPAHDRCGCEPELFDEVTLTVLVSGKFNIVGQERRVGPVLTTQLEECDPPAPDDVVGNAKLTKEEARLPKAELNKLLAERAWILKPYKNVGKNRRPI